MRIGNISAAVLVLCGLLTAGAGIYVVTTTPAAGERWPDAGPIIIDKTGTMNVSTADHIWWNADDLWHLNHVLMSFELISPNATALKAIPDEIPTSDDSTKPPFWLSVRVLGTNNPQVSIAASAPLRNILGENCLENAIQPLLEREAKSAVWDYEANLVIAYVETAFKTTIVSDPVRRSKLVWIPFGGFLLLLGLSLRNKRSKRTYPKTNVATIIEHQTGIKTEDYILASLKAAIEVADNEVKEAQERVKVADTDVIEAEMKKETPTWKWHIPVIGWTKKRDARRKFDNRKKQAERERAFLTEAISRRSSAELDLERGHVKFDERRAREIERAKRWASSLIFMSRAGIAAASVIGLVTSALASYDVTAPAHPSGGLISVTRMETMLQPGSPLYAAIEANRDLIEPFRNRCHIALAYPSQPAISTSTEPQAYLNTTNPVAPSSQNQSAEINSLAPSSSSGPHCVTGKACGDSCIPQDRICHLNQDTTSTSNTASNTASPSTTHGPNDQYNVQGYFRNNGTYVAPYERHYPGGHK